MHITPAVLDMTALEDAENDLRRRLRSQPDDIQVRLSLAWCLLMRALHQSGQEAAAVVNDAVLEQAEGTAVMGGETEWNRGARTTLKECLQQNYIVRHLADKDEDRQSTDRILDLVNIMGARAAVSDAETDCTRRFSNLMREIGLSAECET